MTHAHCHQESCEHERFVFRDCWVSENRSHSSWILLFIVDDSLNRTFPKVHLVLRECPCLIAEYVFYSSEIFVKIRCLCIHSLECLSFFSAVNGRHHLLVPFHEL